MMECEFRKHLEGRGLSAEAVDFSMAAVEELEEYLGKNGTTFDVASLDVLKGYVLSLMEAGSNSLERLVAIARYCSFARKNDYLVYLVSLFGARNVLPGIGERLALIAGDETRNRVFEGFELPPLGSSQEGLSEVDQDDHGQDGGRVAGGNMQAGPHVELPQGAHRGF